MKLTRFKLYDNYIVYLFILFLPFSYALTFRIGFPLKISELALALLAILFLIRGHFRFFALHTTASKLLFAFIGVAILSTLINLFWDYSYPFKEFDSRVNNRVDSIMKLFYLFLAFFTFLISSNAVRVNKDKYINLFLIGAILASIYGWYLFFSSLLGVPYFLLPGMINPLQKFSLLGTQIVRTGTFLEGNYMGLFLLVAGIVALYHKKYKTAIYLLISIVTTVSTMAISCLIIFLGLHFFKQYFTKRNLHKLLIIFIIGFSGLSLLSINPAFRAVIIEKFTGDTQKLTYASYSKADRLNTALTATNIGIANPAIGVGLGNYALHYDKYNLDNRFPHPDFKVIPNNIYAELIAETGFIGFLLFIAFYLILLRTASVSDSTGILRNGLIVLGIYFMTFPTYTILFIWFYFALIASVGSVTSKQSLAPAA